MSKWLQKKGDIKKFNFNNLKYILIPAAILFVIFASLPVFSLNSVKLESVLYEKKSVEDPNIELNETKLIQSGTNGEKEVTYKNWKSFFNIIFGGQIGESRILKSETKVEPLEELTAKGLRKYQYMYCTDGSYRYFTDEQFKDKNTGFTHKSNDKCSENGQGKMAQLADGLPGSNKTNYVPVTAYIPSNCSQIPIPFTTSFQNVTYLSEGQTQSSGGYDGYKVICTASSSGFKPSDYTIQPINKITYVGIGTSYSSPDNSAAISAAARQKCTSDYNYAKAQIGMAGAGDSSAMVQLNALYTQCLNRAG